MLDGPDRPLWIFAEDGRQITASETARQFERSDATGTGYLRRFLAEGVANVRAGQRQILRNLSTITPDGTETDLTLRVGWLVPGDRTAGLIGTLHDPARAPACGCDTETERGQAGDDGSDLERLQLERFLHMADSAAGAVYERVDTPEGRWIYTYHSAGMPDLFGVTAEEIAADGYAIFRHIDPAEVREIEAKVAEVRQTGESLEVLLNVHHPLRGPRVVLLTTRPYPQPDGNTIWFGKMADMTRQVSAERRALETAQKLGDSHRRLDRLADNAPGALWEYRVNAEGKGHFAYFSAKLPGMVGVDAESLQTDPAAFLRYIPKAEVERMQEAFKEASRTLSPYSFCFTLNHPEAGRQRMLLSSQAVYIGEGVTSWFANLLDVTKQEETEARAARTFEELSDLHQRLSSLAGTAPAALFEFRLTEDERADFPFFTARMPELMGVPAEEIERDGETVFDAIHPEDLPAVRADTEHSVATLEHFSQTFRTHRRNGVQRWVTATAQPVVGDTGTVRWFGVMFDATERMEAEHRATQAAEELRRAHERFLFMAENAPGAIFEFRIEADGRIRFPYVSARLPDLIGIPVGRLSEDPNSLYDTVPEEEKSTTRASIRDAIISRQPQTFRHRVIHPTRGERWIQVSLNPDSVEGTTFGGFGNATDATEDMRRETELREAHELAEGMRRRNEHQAMHDGLTGLPNRRYYDAEAERRRVGCPTTGSIVRIDLDYFKSVNDTLGHEAGDLVLRRVAQVLRDTLGPGDFAARIGGDEFSILPAPARPLSSVCELVERIRENLAQPLYFEDRQCRFGASFGIARTENMDAESLDLPIFADAALYKAKKEGRNRLELFTPELRQTLLTERRIATELHEALERSEFEPWFQPQFSARGERLVGVEALLRWPRQDGSVLSPEAFMHVAENLRIVPEIDRMMMIKAGAALKRWREAGVVVPKISFNVSSGRMRDPDVVALAREVASGHTRVAFELLESILVEEESETFRFHLDMVREAGIDIEIDDFGSGHASIIGLMQIAPSALKIDKRIVMPSAGDARSRNLVRAIVEIAETLGIATVAEGVESPELARILRDMGCDVLQGYHYARAMNETSFAEMTRRWNVGAA